MSDQPTGLGLWVASGRDPDPEHTALLSGAILDPMDLRGLGIEETVAELVERFEHVPHARAIMKLARAAGISFGEAQHRWRDPEDLAAELAWDEWQRMDAERCCPDCGLNPELLTDDRGRTRVRGQPVGVVKVSEFYCPACDLMQKARREHEDAERKAVKEGGTGYGNAIKHRFAYRPPGDPLID